MQKSVTSVLYPERTENGSVFMHRRDLIKSSGIGALAGALAVASSPREAIAAGPAPLSTSSHPKLPGGLTIESIERTTVKLPYRAVPARNMARELPHWRYLEIAEVTLDCGVSGFGETMLYYTWGATDDSDVERAQGRNAIELLWDDSLGAGLQMALFDAVARAFEVPIHRLLGQQVHERTPLSWWDIELSPEDLALECADARDLGYTAFKTKGRPWFDVFEQVEAAAAVVPESFKIDLDFNDTLLDAARGIPILTKLEKIPQVGIYETPIPQSDIEGNQAIRKATRVPIAMHYGSPKPMTAFKEEVCDGFVVGGGASRLLQIGAVTAMAEKPFWLQLVGSEITAAYSLHFGGVLEQAVWPAVNCHQLFDDYVLTKSIAVEDGTAAVPNVPGLGFELDREKIAKYRVEKPEARPDPERLIETTWPDGTIAYTANNGRVNFMLTQGQRGTYPYFVDGAMTRVLPDDGSDRWRDLYERSKRKPLIITK